MLGGDTLATARHQTSFPDMWQKVDQDGLRQD